MEIIMSFQWTNENIFKLIEMFEERELLWNTILDEYRDRNKKHDAWCEIANVFELEKSVIEKKMKSLIGQFQRELKKAKSGAGQNEISKWFAFKKMMFLRNRNKPASTCDVGVKDNNDNNEKDKEGDIEEEGNIEKNKTFATPKHNTYRKRARPQDNSSEEALNILKELHGSRKKRDEFDVFGEHVAVKLRNLNNSHAKHTAQFHINNILYNAAIGEYDWSSFNSSPSYHGTASNSGYGDNTSGPSTLSESSINTRSPSAVTQSSVDNSTQSLDEILNDIQQ